MRINGRVASTGSLFLYFLVTQINSNLLSIILSAWKFSLINVNHCHRILYFSFTTVITVSSIAEPLIQLLLKHQFHHHHHQNIHCPNSTTNISIILYTFSFTSIPVLLLIPLSSPIYLVYHASTVVFIPLHHLCHHHLPPNCFPFIFIFFMVPATAINIYMWYEDDKGIIFHYYFDSSHLYASVAFIVVTGGGGRRQSISCACLELVLTNPSLERGDGGGISTQLPGGTLHLPGGGLCVCNHSRGLQTTG